MSRRNYYLFNPGRMSRKDNTLKFVAIDENGYEQKPKYLPIEGIKSLYIFGSVDSNSAMFNFLGKQKIPVHFFDYYEHYTGSFKPKEFLLAGKMLIEQTKAYLDRGKRSHIARNLIKGAIHNMLQNLKYYTRRKTDFTDAINTISGHTASLDNTYLIPEMMGIEGNCRQVYYSCFNDIVTDYEMNERTKQPPSNELNALISFGNMMTYTQCLDQIYHTQLNPTISFLHEPGYRRYSLALDIAEIFKPLLVDRTIFRLTNRKEIKPLHFEKKLKGCFLKDPGKKTFIKSYEEKLKDTIKHRVLKKQVSYQHLIRLECYKIAKYILGIEPEYQPFKIWW
jgi:CRISPR-associated protein Cas1